MLDMIFSLSTLWWVMLILYIPACFGLVIVVLLQKGKGVGFAGAFGAGGGSDAVFGPRSSKSLPQKITYGMATIYMLLALLMSMLSGNVGSSVAPELVEDTGETPVFTGEGGGMDALFSDSQGAAPAETAPEATEPAPENTPVNAVETPAQEAPAEEAPAEEAAAETTEESTPAEDPPAEAADEAPAGEAPVEEAPAEDADGAPAE